MYNKNNLENVKEIRFTLRKKRKPEIDRKVSDFYKKSFYQPEETLSIIREVEEEFDNLTEKYDRDLDKETPIYDFIDEEDIRYENSPKLDNISELLVYQSDELEIHASFDYRNIEQSSRFGLIYNSRNRGGRNKIQVTIQADSEEVPKEEFNEYDQALIEMGFT